MDNSPFYAYITCASTYYSPTLVLPRSVMVFSNGSVADEWWRFVSAAHSSKSGSSDSPDYPSYLAYLLGDKDFTITRTSAQLYMCKSKKMSRILINRIFGLDPLYEKFEGKLFVEQEGKTSSIVPSMRLTEHISGNWYYIRAKHDRNVYWINRRERGREIMLTTTNDTLRPAAFKIVGIDVPEGTVLIGSDKIKLLLGREHFLSYQNFYTGGKLLVIAARGEPGTGEPAEFLFSALGDGSITGLAGLPYGGISCELVNARL
ncbi:hypothetical protein BDP27DRAFT_110945 [Rhodocollybia butyracea]|nr:hypothetical protein BDP27DRAFT_110945 [Rhodocollybia butyracea]